MEKAQRTKGPGGNCYRCAHRRPAATNVITFHALLLVIVALLPRCAHGSWVDPDSPELALTTDSLTHGDDRQYELVFSDEFEQEGRTFRDGDDPRWTALNKNDYTNDALHFYSHDNARTTNGVLNITTERKENTYRAFDEDKKKFYSDKKHIQSAMVQGWNKFCFTGGIVEFSAKLPGNPNIGGLWPALWMLGNLARATFVGSSNYVWPYSYNKCDPDRRMSQEINACSKVNHYGLEPNRGRGAPEIDVIEAMQGEAEKLPSTSIQRPYQSASLQIAPGVDMDRPSVGNRPHKGHWYTGMEYPTDNETLSELNPFFYGVKLVHEPKQYTYQADALSANLQLDKDFYENQHIYRVEWEPPANDGTGGYIRWYTDEKFIYGIQASTLEITGAEIPSEPMYMLMNTAVASSWGFPAPCPDGCKCSCFECGNPECACALPPNYCDNFPASFEIDFIRVYQAVNESKHILGCSPKDRPTKMFIQGHEDRYMEKGQKHPLEEIQIGGASCTRSEQCGGVHMGRCTHKGVCACFDGFTGPSCLAHVGSYDNESTSMHRLRMRLHSIYFPQGLIAVLILLILGFVVSMLDAIRNKPKHMRYSRLKTSNSMVSDGAAQTGIPSYQNQSRIDYALPPKQNDVTYCVIDGRLANDLASSNQ